MKRQIPNIITLANLICGTLIIISAFQLKFVNVAYFAVAALLFDFLDGTAARLLNVSSAIGKELDSMADMVSFGAAPALVLYCYWTNEMVDQPFNYFPLLIAAFSGYRLAKFNISEQSNDYFSGLPTPALALGAFALPLAAEQFEMANIWLTHPAFVVIFSVLGGVLLVSNLKLFSIKLGSKNKALNVIRIVMLVCGLLLIGWLHFFGAFLCLILYLAFSLSSQKHIT
ncbi:MAG: CDP-alcohol phosphatidyltransferase family protein [Bacteroidia bacterium]